MKLHNILLTAAFLFTASVAFAETKTHTPVDWDSASNARHMTVNVTVFPMNNSWEFYVAGYDANGDLIEGTKTLLDKNDSSILEKTYSKDEVDSIVLPDTLTANEQSEIKKKSRTHGVYEFSVDFTDKNIDHFGLISTNPQSVSSVINSSNNDFFSLVRNDEGVVYYGMGQLAYNNGAVLLVGVEKTFGTPLPAPVVTLLIALGFGAGFVMYRNRKQVKA